MICVDFACFRANDTDENRNQAHINGIKRVPLNEIPKNTPSPTPMKGYKLVNKHCEINDDMNSKMKSEVLQLSLESPGSQAKCSSRSYLDEISSCGIELNDFGSGEMKLDVPLESSGMYSNGTLARQPSCSNRFNSNYINQVGQPDCCTLSSSLTECDVFSDDFDDSILEEIETLCGQKSAEKSEKEKCDMKPTEIQCVNVTPGEDKANIDLFVKDEKLKTEHILKSSGDSDSRGEAMRYSEDTVTKNMPDEYAKYICSLSDRQREAACSDISTPLIIVAGPGSGKVFSFHFC